MKVLDILPLDRYDFEAVLIPAIISIILMVGASWQLIDYISLDKSVDTSSTVLAISTIAIIGVWYQVVRIAGKKIVETAMFGGKLQFLPTTRYLMYSDEFGDSLLADKVRNKIEKDFGIELKSKAQEKKNQKAAAEIIVSAVKLVKQQVQTSNNEMYLRKNIRYGLFRNTTGGCLLAVLAEIVFAIVSIVNSTSFTLGWAIMAVTVIIMIITYRCAKDTAAEYANELFETYINIA